MKAFLQPVWRILISVKLAVVVMSSMTIAMIVATVLESVYDTPSALYYVYRTWWFYGIMGALGLNILCVALSRLPWQKKHIHFLLAHAGILILLYGSWLTDKFGLDGMLSITEGRTESAVELTQPLLVVTDGANVKTIPLKWIPPEVKFKPIAIPEYGIRVAEWITHAEPKVMFVPAVDSMDSQPAIRVKVAGGPSAPPFMKMGQESWIWAGDPSWNRVQVGPAGLSIAADRDSELPQQGPGMAFRYDRGSNRLHYVIQTSDGKKTSGKLDFKDPKDLEGHVIQTPWRFEATVTILEWHPRASTEVTYSPSRTQYGQSAPPPAIRLQGEGTTAKESQVWLGQGDRATLELAGKKLTIGFFPKRVVLPFGIQLQKFQIDHYEGTANPSEFSSVVSVIADAPSGADQGNRPKEPPPKDVLISMNEPMKYGGYTFYQSSYVDAQPRPVTSIFSVNQDPGRWLKYLGSFLLVLGSILLFAEKYKKRKT